MKSKKINKRKFVKKNTIKKVNKKTKRCKFNKKYNKKIIKSKKFKRKRNHFNMIDNRYLKIVKAGGSASKAIETRPYSFIPETYEDVNRQQVARTNGIVLVKMWTLELQRDAVRATKTVRDAYDAIIDATSWLIKKQAVAMAGLKFKNDKLINIQNAEKKVHNKMKNLINVLNSMNTLLNNEQNTRETYVDALTNDIAMYLDETGEAVMGAGEVEAVTSAAGLGATEAGLLCFEELNTSEDADVAAEKVQNGERLRDIASQDINKYQLKCMLNTYTDVKTQAGKEGRGLWEKQLEYLDKEKIDCQAKMKEIVEKYKGYIGYNGEAQICTKTVEAWKEIASDMAVLSWAAYLMNNLWIKVVERWSAAALSNEAAREAKIKADDWMNDVYRANIARVAAETGVIVARDKAMTAKNKAAMELARVEIMEKSADEKAAMSTLLEMRNQTKVQKMREEADAAEEAMAKARGEAVYSVMEAEEEAKIAVETRKIAIQDAKQAVAEAAAASMVTMWVRMKAREAMIKLKDMKQLMHIVYDDENVEILYDNDNKIMKKIIGILSDANLIDLPATSFTSLTWDIAQAALEDAAQRADKKAYQYQLQARDDMDMEAEAAREAAAARAARKGEAARRRAAAVRGVTGKRANTAMDVVAKVTAEAETKDALSENE